MRILTDPSILELQEVEPEPVAPHRFVSRPSEDDEATLAGLDLCRPPEHDVATYPDGVNVELVVRRGGVHVGMRVHERGSGETRSCGTGAGAVMVATAVADGADPSVTGRQAMYRVDVPGGMLAVTWSPEGHVYLTGPAIVVARGTTSL